MCKVDRKWKGSRAFPRDCQFHEVHAEALTCYLLQFLGEKEISLATLRGLGFDGTNKWSTS